MVNLKKTRGNIIKIRSRDRSGRLIHKSQISCDDEKSAVRELRVWIDKLGVSREVMKKALINKVPDEDQQIIAEMMKENIKKSDEKVKEFLKK